MDLHCPACKKNLNAFFAVNLSNSKPRMGDIIFCGHCRMVSVIANVAPYELRVMSDAEILSLPEQDQEDLKFAAKIQHASHTAEN